MRSMGVRRASLAVVPVVLAVAVTVGSPWAVSSQTAGAASQQAGDASALPLDNFLGRLAAALRRPVGASAHRALRAVASAESRSGVRRLRIRDFQVLSDSERSLAGYNLGAGSWDTEIGVLGSAVATEFLFQAARTGVSLDAVDVVFTSHQDAGGAAPPAGQVAYPRNLQYTAYLVSSASDAQLEALRVAVERTSPVLNFVADRQDIPHGRVVHTPSPAAVAAGTPPGLRDFLVEKRAALQRRDQQATSGTRTAPPLRAHVRVEGGTGLRHIRTGPSNFQILHDNPRDLAGFDLGPSVEEHQLGVMGTCLTHIFEIQAAQRQVVLDALEIAVEGTLTPRSLDPAAPPPRLRDVRYTVSITSPASAREIDELRQAVEAVCPIYNLLKDPQTITGRIVRTRYDASVTPTARR
jgi:hypothetical protein